MSYIASYQSIRDHHQTHRLVSSMNLDHYKTIGHIHALLWWALDNCDDSGNIPATATPGAIAQGSGITPDLAEQWLGALIDSGHFIEREDGTLTIRDWQRFTGKITSYGSRQNDLPSGRPDKPQAQKPQNKPVPHVEPIADNEPKREPVVEQDSTLTALVTLWESEIKTPITAMTAEFLKDWITQYPSYYFQPAFKEAALQNRRVPSYIRSILENWKASNYTDLDIKNRKSNKGNGNGQADKPFVLPKEWKKA